MSTAVSASAVARVVGIKTTFRDLRAGAVNLLPQRVALVGQGATASTYSTDKAQYASAFDVGTAYGFGSPVHLAAKELLPANGDGIGSIPLTVYPLDDDASGLAAAGDITPSGTVTEDTNYFVRINNIDSQAFTVTSTDTVATICAKITAAVNATLDIPMTATDNTTNVGFTSKWKGASANALYLEVIGSTTAGVTWAYTQPTGGATNPDVDTALNQVGEVWETLFLNCMDVADTTTLGKFATFGEGRWGALVKKPCVVFTGYTSRADPTVATMITVSNARKTDRVNSQLVAPGSKDLPFVVGARQLARIAVIANDNPPTDYAGQKATGLTPGDDGDQWNYTERDTAVKGGSSTIEVKDGVVNLSDTVTFYHPDGDPTPAYRYVVDVVKLQNIIYNLELIFASDDWAGAPLIPDDQATTNRNARKPSAAKAAVAAVLDSLGLEAIISDPATAKASITAAINSSNPKRLDVTMTVQLSGNANIISIDLDFGFYFGVAPIV